MAAATPSRKYTLYIQAVAARNLKSADTNGFSDPFLVFQVGTHKDKTTVKKKNLNPRWNENFTFEDVNPEDVLKIIVWDWDRISSHDFLGQFEVSLKALEDGKTKDSWFKLTGEKEVSGEVHLLLHLTTATKRPLLQPSVSAEGRGLLVVEVLSGRDLLGGKDFLGRGHRCIYTQVRFQSEKHKTSTLVLEADENPEWEDEIFYFEANEADSESQQSYLTQALKVDLYDSHLLRRVLLGSFSIPMNNLTDGKLRDEWYKLISKERKENPGELRVRIQYTSAAQSQRNYVVAQRYYGDLVKLLIVPDIVIIASMCKVYDSAELIRSIVNIFSSEQRVQSLLNQLIYRELKATKQETTLFRTDSATTKAILAYLKICAKSLLSEIVSPLLRDVEKNVKVDANGNCNYEVDPAKLGDSTFSIEANVETLRQTCQAFLDRVYASASSCPLEVKRLFANLRKLVEAVYPNSSLLVVGAFFFLRFICPAIASPQGFNLLKESPKKEVKRALTLIGKVIQNTANFQRFKEEYMAPFNSFVDANLEKMKNFYNNISTVDETNSISSTFIEEDKTKDMATIVKYLAIHMAAIEKEIDQDPRIRERGPQYVQSTKQQIETLKQILS